MNSNFSILHINARSLVKNFDSILIYIASLQHTFTVIAISETWITDSNDSLINIPGYNRVLNNRTEGRGGGVALFILNSLTFTIKSNCIVNVNGEVESIFVDISSKFIKRKQLELYTKLRIMILVHFQMLLNYC